jgi:hypothetical protein
MRLRPLFAGMLLLAACSGQTPDGVARIPSDSAGIFRAQIDELRLVSATKDSLYNDLAETTRLIADINTELATVRTQSRNVSAVTSPESPLSASSERAEVLGRVRELTQRVRQSEANLRATRQRLTNLTQDSESSHKGGLTAQHSRQTYVLRQKIGRQLPVQRRQGMLGRVLDKYFPAGQRCQLGRVRNRAEDLTRKGLCHLPDDVGRGVCGRHLVDHHGRLRHIQPPG